VGTDDQEDMNHLYINAGTPARMYENVHLQQTANVSVTAMIVSLRASEIIFIIVFVYMHRI